MNKRIKELATEARLLTGWPVGEVEYQRFAELIVKDIHTYVDSLDTAQIISNGILRRYGIEE